MKNHINLNCIRFLLIFDKPYFKVLILVLLITMEIEIARSNDIYYNAINPSECLLLKCYVYIH